MKVRIVDFLKYFFCIIVFVLLEEFKATSAVTNPVVNNAEDDQPQLRRRKPKES